MWTHFTSFQLMKPGLICQDTSTCRINDTRVQIIMCVPIETTPWFKNWCLVCSLRELNHSTSCLWVNLQRRRTFKLLPSLWTEEFKFPTSSAPL
jgi:hypothetical protein